MRTHFSPPFALSSADVESVISLSDGVAQCSDRAESVTAVSRPVMCSAF